jgi:hypothetical protein
MNYDIILRGENEFFPKLNNKTYNILKVDDKKKEQFMNNIFKKFIDKKDVRIIAIDFEFNKVSKTDRDVALMQLNLEDESDIAFIFIFKPIEIDTTTLLELLTNRDIIKILHGGESLDIPYLFNQLLSTKENVNNFSNNFYDTKYLCDFNNVDLEVPEKCGIYHLLINNKIITQEKLEELDKLSDKLGPLYLIQIDIYNLSYDLLNYSLYDVIYLPELLKKFLSRNNFYTKIIPEIAVIIHKSKRQIEPQFDKITKIVNYLNYCYIKKDDKQVFLKDIYNIVIEKFNKTDIFKLKQINYFKNFIETILKLYIFYNIESDNIIYNNNTNEPINEINFNFYFIWLKQYQNFYILINNHIKLIKINIDKII